MKIELNLNPDEALALIQVLERDHIFPDVTGPIIRTLDEARLDWANDAAIRAGRGKLGNLLINPADADAWNRWAEKHKVNLLDITMHVKAAEDLAGYPLYDRDEGSVYVLDGYDNLVDITPHVFSKGE